MAQQLKREYYRLIKDVRVVFPAWLFGIIGLYLYLKVVFLFDEIFFYQTLKRMFELYSIFLYIFVSFYISCTLFNHEFMNQTMELLLSRPIHRLQLWYEKFVVLIVCNLSLFIIYCYAANLNINPEWEVLILRNLYPPYIFSWIMFAPEGKIVKYLIALFLSPLFLLFLVSIVIGPFIALYLKNKHFVVVFSASLVFFILLFIIALTVGERLTAILDGNQFDNQLFIDLYILLISIFCYLMARRRFQRMEI